MKKTIALILAILMLVPCFVTGAFAGILDDEGYEPGIAEGYVRTKEVYKNSFGETRAVANVYDEDGFLIKTVEAEHSEDGYACDTKITTAYAYGSDGSLTKKAQRLVSDDGFTSKLTVTYAYDRNGTLAKETTVDKRYNYGELTFSCKTTRTYSFNRYGNPVKIVDTTKDSEGTYTETQTFTYDWDNNLTKTTLTRASGSKKIYTGTTTYSYDKYGYLCQVSEKEYWLEFGSEESTVTTYTNDRDARVLKEDVYFVQENGRTTRDITTNTYRGGQLSKSTTIRYSDGSRFTTRVTSYTYDKNGNLTKETVNYRSDEPGDDYSYKSVTACSYDKAGNLLKKVTSFRTSYGDTSKEVWAYKYKKMWNF